MTHDTGYSTVEELLKRFYHVLVNNQAFFLAKFRQPISTQVGGFLSFSSFSLSFFGSALSFLRKSLSFLGFPLSFGVSGKTFRLSLSFYTQKQNQISNL